MKKYLKSTGLLLLALLMVLSGCNNQTESISDFSIEGRYTPTADTPAWKLDTAEDVPLKWYVNADWLKFEWGVDETTKRIKEDLNIDVTFVHGDDTILATMFSGSEEDMPDIITIFDSTSTIAKKADTWAYPLTELAEKYDPYFNKVAVAETMKWFELEDGKTYGYPNYSNTAADYESGVIPANDNFVIRKDVYDALGQPDFSTPESFVASMKLIKENYPSMTPFGFTPVGKTTGAFTDKLQDFLGVPLVDDSSEYYDRNMDEDYLTWIKAINQVYRDGNISDDSFADDGPTFHEKVKEGQYATMLIAGSSGLGSQLQTFTNNSGTEYIAIDGPTSTMGREIGLNQTGISGWMTTYVTKQAKDPAKAIQLFTYLLDEPGGILTRYGVENVTYDYNDEGKIEFLPEVLALRESNPEEYNTKYRISSFLFFNHDRYNALGAGLTEQSLQQLQEWGKGKLEPHFIVEQIKPDTGTAEARSLETITTHWNQTLISAIRASSEADVEKLFADHKAFRDSNGWSGVLDVYNQKIESNQERLNIE